MGETPKNCRKKRWQHRNDDTNMAGKTGMLANNCKRLSLSQLGIGTLRKYAEVVKPTR